MDDAGGPFVARASAAITGAPRLEGYARGDVAAVLAGAADERAALQQAIDQARQAALVPPTPLDVVPRAAADEALQAAEARLAAMRAELADAQAQLQHAQLSQAQLVPLTIPVAAPVEPAIAPDPSRLTWSAAPAAAVEPAFAADAPTVAVPLVAAAAAPLPIYQQPAYPQPMYQQPMYQQPMYQQPLPPQVIVSREPFSRATGMLQVVTWSIVVAVVLIVLLAWFA